MKTVNVYSRHEAEEQGKYKVYLYLLIIAAILAIMVVTEFGTKLY